jgi:hypothetical protein
MVKKQQVPVAELGSGRAAGRGPEQNYASGIPVWQSASIMVK